jgi:hypothetical protein
MSPADDEGHANNDNQQNQKKNETWLKQPCGSGRKKQGAKRDKKNTYAIHDALNKYGSHGRRELNMTFICY